MDKSKKKNPLKQRSIYFYEYFRRHFSKDKSYRMALHFVPDCILNVDDLEIIYMSHRINARRKLMLQKQG